MKRSEINRAIQHALKVLDANSLRLPPFAYWNMDEWQKNAAQLDNLKTIMLGWDVSDFGSGDFESMGSVLFTIRNGYLPDKAYGTPYAEKFIILTDRAPQALPMHYHVLKTEDIINRGGGVLAMQLYASAAGALDKESMLTIKMDGIPRTLRPGEIIEVEKGCSVTLTPGIYHSFWAKKGCGDLVAGEVSSINDDNTDNVFLDPRPRFSTIEEDEPGCYPLCNEYDRL